MRKIMNEPTGFVDETIDSILAALPELVAVGGDRRVLARAGERPAGRVGIVTGGGSGHLPLFLGYVGEGLCTAVAIGNVFSSPSVDQMHAATMAADAGAGVLYLYGNYGGDVMNFDLAGDLAADDGVETATVLGVDDIMSAPADRRDERRGVAGIVFAYKCAGAAADRGDDLAEVARIARAAVDATRTAGVGLSATILPTTGRSSFDLDAGDMEIGIGIHGEPGIERTALTSADRADRPSVESAPLCDRTMSSRILLSRSERSVSAESVVLSRPMAPSMLRRCCSAAERCPRNVMADAVPDGSSLGTAMRRPLESSFCSLAVRARLACRPRSVPSDIAFWVTRPIPIQVTAPRFRSG